MVVVVAVVSEQLFNSVLKQTLKNNNIACVVKDKHEAVPPIVLIALVHQRPSPSLCSFSITNARLFGGGEHERHT